MTSTSLTFRDQYFPLLQERSFQSLSIELSKLIELITLDEKYPPKIVGSFKHIVHEYPADIDLFENYIGDDYETTISYVVKRFQQIATKIKAMEPAILLGDFKTGYDDQYFIELGTVSADDIPEGYYPDRIRESLRALYDRGLLEKRELKEGLHLVSNRPTYLVHQMLSQFVRRFYVLRWSLDEIISGKKQLRGNRSIRFVDAMKHIDNVIKIDLLCNLNGRYVEMTNWYAINFRGSENPQFISIEPPDYRTSLSTDIQIYAQPRMGKQMKMAKRLWLLAVHDKNRDLMIRLYPLFSNGAAKIYQILGEMETLEKVIEKHPPEISSLYNTLDDWKMRLGTVPETVLPVKEAAHLFEVLTGLLKTKSTRRIRETVEEVRILLDARINNYVRNWLQRRNIVALDFIAKRKPDV